VLRTQVLQHCDNGHNHTTTLMCQFQMHQGMGFDEKCGKDRLPSRQVQPPIVLCSKSLLDSDNHTGNHCYNYTTTHLCELQVHQGVGFDEKRGKDRLRSRQVQQPIVLCSKSLLDSDNHTGNHCYNYTTTHLCELQVHQGVGFDEKRGKDRLRSRQVQQPIVLCSKSLFDSDNHTRNYSDNHTRNHSDNHA
jgi:hypothetical protein